MYSPKEFLVDESSTIDSFIAAYSFATVVNQSDGTIQASHVPILAERSNDSQHRLFFHLARANPQWKSFGPDAAILAIFQGPHSYISPANYRDNPSVPTWNYTAVHATGIARILSEDELGKLMEKMVRFYESQREVPWIYELPESYRTKMLKAIVGIEMTVTKIECKFKLSQNRPGDRDSVITSLEGSSYPGDQEMARFMRSYDEGAIVDPLSPTDRPPSR